MKIMNALSRLSAMAENTAVNALRYEGFSILLRLLSPVVPHITHTLWQQLGYGENVLDAPWPVVDETALVRDMVNIVVQVNGKVRAQIEVAADADKTTIEQLALATPNAQRFIEGKPVRKIILVPGKLVNIVC
jgi:leucyl-tRNA synthetase